MRPPLELCRGQSSGVSQAQPSQVAGRRPACLKAKAKNRARAPRLHNGCLLDVAAARCLRKPSPGTMAVRPGLVTCPPTSAVRLKL